MSEPYVGEIRMFAGNFAPRGYAFCDGQLLAVSQNDALFSLLGTIYGGDGRTTFGLPDLRGRLPIHVGQGPGLSNRTIGQRGGTEEVALSESQIAPHNHPARSASGGNAISPVGGYWSTDPGGNSAGYNTGADGSELAATVIGPSGGAQPHDNVQPFLCIGFIIALFGIYPSRN
jgi:microcystin-dependent protein